MNLLVDSRWIGSHGIGRFAQEVITRLPWPLLHRKHGSPSDALDPVKSSVAIAHVRASAYFTPGYNPPLVSRVPFAFTLHDLIHIDKESSPANAKRLYYEVIVRPAIRRAAAVLTVSEFSRQRIIEWSGMDARNCVVVGNGVSSAFTPFGRVHAHSTPYVLYVGNQKPHKNVGSLLRALMYPGLKGLHLLMTGVMTRETGELVQGLGLQDRVRCIGALSDNELAAYYRGATLVAVPSKIEGFGLPLAEGMACGVPVVASDIGVFREISGGAALLVEPTAEQLAGGIMRVLSDRTLAKHLAEAGPQTASVYRWNRVADRVACVLGEVLTR